MLDEFKEEKDNINFKNLVCVKSDGSIFNFNVFKSSLDFASDISNGKISLEEAKNSQYKMFKLLDYLREHDPTNLDKIKPREKTINNVRKLHNNRNNDIKTFENGVVFSFSHGFQKEKLDMSDKTLAK